MTIQAADFPNFFESVNGYPPFPWQARLAEEVIAKGWPKVIDLPTGSGKTAVIDIAVFALAVQSRAAPGTRTTPMRVALVVDRRIVVDAAFERAQHLAQHLDAAESGISLKVANALRAYGAEVPLRASLLRGGIYREDRFARQPNQPAVLCSTVDQVGSRLLHRGYGLSPRMWPIHAGLLGEDALLVLDEAHASVPFGQTLSAIEAMRRRRQTELGRPWGFVEMSATSRRDGGHFELDEADLECDILSQRLRSKKPIALRVATKKGDGALLKSLTAAVRESAKAGQTLLCVVNRVSTARALHEQLVKLSKKKKDGLDAGVVLLTGRARAIDRDRLVQLHGPRLMAGRDRAAVAAQQTLIVVATQCVEVGADFDVDALVSEAAPLDSLRQRLGRLDRLGERGEAPCTLVCPFELAWDGDGDPPKDFIYGEATARTWGLLTERANRADEAGALDGGSLALAAVSVHAEADCLAPASRAPTMLPAHCELWAHTQPPPKATPEPALFLHGIDAGEPDVQLVYRADLDGLPPERWVEAAALAPPVSAEALPLRISAVRSWLAGKTKKLAEFGDVAGLADAKPAKLDGDEFRVALAWRGPEASELLTGPEALRPGMTLVVPCSYGGCDEFGWSPTSVDVVDDRADAARMVAKRAPALRLTPAIVGEWPATVRALSELRDTEAPEDLEERAEVALKDLASLDSLEGQLAAALERDPKRRIVRHPAGQGVVIVGKAGWSTGAQDFTDEDDSSSRAPAPQRLDDHLDSVRTQARAFAEGAGLESDLVDDLGLAGWLHDLGKADPRFQAWLHQGNRLAAKRAGLLAKSNGLALGLANLRRSRDIAGYPAGGRHELLSVRLAESTPELLAQAHDRDLVLHLVESHHGYCRPFAPVVHDENPLDVTLDLNGHSMKASSATKLELLDAGPAQRFEHLNARYGHWGLAYLEACLRLADHRASEAAEGKWSR